MFYLTCSLVARPLMLLSVALLLLTCNRDTPLPLPTQSGQNTLGCLINGKPYIPDGGRGFMPAKPVNGGFFVLRSSPYTLGLYVYTYAKDNQRIEIFLNDYKLGLHPLNSNTQIKPASLSPKDYGVYESTEGDAYVTNSEYTGQVIITKADTISGIVAGSFSFKAISANGKTVTVSQGRFDVNARTQ